VKKNSLFGATVGSMGPIGSGDDTGPLGSFKGTDVRSKLFSTSKNHNQLSVLVVN